MTEQAEKISVHRFRDSVAFHVEGKTETLYLSPEHARQLAKQLRRYATDCERVPFTESQLTTMEIPRPKEKETATD